MICTKAIINKVKKETFWYKKYIGQEIEVCADPMVIDGIEMFLSADLSKGFFLYKEDITIISDSTYNKNFKTYNLIPELY